LLADKQREFLCRFVLIVTPAAKDDVLDRRRPAGGIRDDVVEFQDPRSVHRPAAPTNVHCPSSRVQTARRRGYVAGSLGYAAARLWPSSRGPLGLLEVLHQHRQCSIEDRCRVTIRNSVPQQVLCKTQPLIGLLAHRELDFVARRGQRRDDGRAH